MTPKRPTRLLPTAAAAVISLTALAAVAPAASARSAEFAKAPAGKAPTGMTVEVGESVKVRLETNPSTGYSWTTSISGDKSAITLSKGVYKPPSGGGAGGSVGAAGVTVWTITGKAAGKAIITFKSIPPGGGAAAETVKVPVTVS